MNTFYGSNPTSTSCKSAIHAQNPIEKSDSLGIFTKTHVMPTAQGFQRIHNFLLQDQSAKLLPKERVSNCLKKRIDKTKLREIKYNEERKKGKLRDQEKDKVNLTGRKKTTSLINRRHHNHPQPLQNQKRNRILCH